MNKENNTEEKFVAWLKIQIAFYTPILGIDLHNIEVEKNETQTAYLGMQCNFPYLDPMFYYHNNAVKSWEEGKLKRDRVLHELCHIITDPLYVKSTARFVTLEDLKDEREKLTDTFAAIIRNLTDKK